MEEQIDLGKWTEKRFSLLMKEASGIGSIGERIAFLSRYFLKTAYKESTLIGDVDRSEVFVINLEAVDCFTFIDYIEAMRRSDSFIEFRENLKKVRYRSGNVSFKHRNHFFTDWLESDSGLVENVTELIGAERSRRARKILNDKGDGTNYVSGIPCIEREIVYLPSNTVDDVIIGRLKSGDYIGIYSDKSGLDVSHVGIIIKDKDKVKFRHASSLHRKVVDEDFKGYIAGKPGIVVLRAKNLWL